MAKYQRTVGPLAIVNVLGVKLELDLRDRWSFFLYETIKKTGMYEQGTTHLIMRFLKEGDVFVDAGANLGYFTILAAKKVGRDGKVYCFEPNPSVTKYLLRNIELNQLENVVVHEKGVSDINGHFMFFVSDKDISLGNVVGPIGKDSQAIQIQTVRMDEELPLGLEVDLAKIDVEGEELNVLRGMQSIIERSPEIKILIEYSLTNSERKKSNPQDLLDFLAQWFSIYQVLDSSEFSLVGPIRSTNMIRERMCMLWCIRDPRSKPQSVKVREPVLEQSIVN